MRSLLPITVMSDFFKNVVRIIAINERHGFIDLIL